MFGCGLAVGLAPLGDADGGDADGGVKKDAEGRIVGRNLPIEPEARSYPVPSREPRAIVWRGSHASGRGGSLGHGTLGMARVGISKFGVRFRAGM